MTLEDFFTLSEMKDGLTSPARVQELIAVMQKQKDCAVKNIADATRQWSAVSSTIAATDNRDCLDLFIQLDGLWFINKWLKDAQKFDTDTRENFAEEAITAMLGALEKLHVDHDKSKSSEIWIIVKNLIDHSSSRIRDRAKELCDHWNQDISNDATHRHVEGGEASHDDVITVSAKHSIEGVQPECLAIDVPLSKERAEGENCSIEPMRDEILPSKSLDGLLVENVEEAHNHIHSNHLSSCTTIGDVDPLPKISTREEPSISAIDGTASIESCTSAPEQRSVGQFCAPNLADSTEDAKDSSDKSGVREISAGSSMLESRNADSCIDVENVHESAGNPDLQNNVCNEIEGLTLKSEPNRRVDDDTRSSKTAGQTADSCIVLPESSDKEHTVYAEASFSKTENCKLPLREKDTQPCSESEALDVSMKTKTEDSQSAYEEKEHVSDADVNLISTPKFNKLVKGVRNSDSIKSTKKKTRKADITKTVKGAKNTDFLVKRSVDFTKPVKDARRHDIDYEYDIMDALAVARQVAKEVEREVIDYRGPSCSSSSDKSSDGGIGQPGTPDSTNEMEDEPISGSQEDILDRQTASSDEYMLGGECSSQTESKDTEPESCLPGMEPSQVTEAAQEPEANSEQGGMCGFDLNQEVCSDDMDREVNAISTLVSVVSASRPAVSPGLPVAPLQFEGTLGWKGSAVTSAFRPASPRRISDGGGIGNGSKGRQDCLDIDLNVAEGEDKFGDLTSGKQMHTSFGLHSGESYVEISSKKPERFQLDLNCLGNDDGDIWKEENLFHNLNDRRRSPSPASSSSVQPSTRNFDLNDRPFHQNDHLERGIYLTKPLQNTRAYGSTKPDEPVISLLGTRVEVKRKDFVPQTISFLSAKSPEFPTDANAARTAGYLGMGPTLSYAHPPTFGYNGVAPGPPIPFPSSIYGAGGSVPYMFDSRGAPVMPQVVGSATTAVPSYIQQPFFMNMNMGGVGPSRPNFDQNSGFVIEGRSRDPSSLKQLLVPGQGRSMDEVSRTNSVSLSSVGGKRKEPDGRWEPYPFNYKQQQPPWK